MRYLAKVRRTLREAREVQRERGWSSAAGFLGRYLYNRSAMVLLESRRKELLLKPPAELEVVAVDARDKALYLQPLEEAGAGSDISNFDRGAVAYVMLAAGRGVAVGWRFPSSVLFAPLGYDPSATVYLGGYFVRDEYRGRGLYPYLAQRMFADAKAATCAIAETALDNVASQRGLAKAGFVRRGVVRRIMLCGCLVRCRLERSPSAEHSPDGI